MAASDKQNPFLGFTRLSSQVYLRPVSEPSDTSNTTAHSNEPTTILIYAWGDARPKHLTKYMEGYLALYPLARLIIVLGPMVKVLYQGLDARSRDMAVVIKAVFGSEAQERVLVHAMSNTGGVNYAATLNAYSKLHPGTHFSHSLLVADSTPGSTSFFVNLGPWSRAMAIGASGWFPGPLFVMQSLAVIFLLVTHAFMFLIGHASPAVFSTSAINDPGLEDKRAERLYLYSKADAIIQWEAVEEHAAEAKGKGYQVGLETFADTPHVGHMRKHPEKYWGAIKEAWEGASGRR
ncbi:hypothetical protein BJ170DRAFT_492811 [Xylariales sp. AK1849]|nr:hypothetical protein BJ170DRAFT_492811 [Xylariales sp. AK1849]